MSKNLLNKISRPFLFLLAVLILAPIQTWALTAANTLIRNQASASFKDETGQSYSVTSNMVETLVQQVAGLDLVQDQSKRGSIGGTVQFPHVLTNVGNGDDSFSLMGTDDTGDQFDFGSISLYADLNQDGQPDDLSSPITDSPLLKPGEKFAFIAVVTVPGTAVSGNQGKLTVVATSLFTNTLSEANTDTVVVTNQAIVDITKAISATAGLAGSGPYTVTLSYENMSALSATNVTLMDALPTGMTYVAGSGRWSETAASALTDANPADLHTASSSTLRYCAYDASCTGLPESAKDADSDSTNQVTAIISQVAAGARGSVSFQVMIAAGLPASWLTNTGELQYHDGVATQTTDSNQVAFQIIQNSGVVTNGSNTLSTDGTAEPITVATANQGGTVVFNDYVWNTGNGEDSFDLALSGSTFPAGSSIQLFHADGFTPLLDTNGNGIPDTGNLDAGEAANIVIKVQLPASAIGNNSGNGYQVTLTATSFKDDTLSNPALNKLTTIASSSVDMTNNALLGAPAALGTGMGPEASAVSTNTAAPGTTTRFTLFINNTSSRTDNYDLSASTDSTFATKVLPAGWSVKFVDDTNKAISNTGIIAPASGKRVFVDVTVPANAASATTSLYFRALSPITAAGDIKHDAVTVGAATDVVLEPNNQGQVLPGGTVIYSHWLTNQGNMPQTNISLTQTNSAENWASQLYADTDGNGVLSGGDARISTVASLGSGESLLIFAKIYAPATAPMGEANLTTLTASWSGGSVQATDLTTTNRSDIVIVKEQALDATCNGVADFAFGLGDFDASPGECVMYRLTATNTGAETMQNVKIQDATPAYTVFNTTGGLPQLSQGALAAPVTQGGRGDVIGAMGTLAPGYSATLIFGIRIE